MTPNKKKILLIVKAAISLLLVTWLAYKIIHRDQMHTLWEKLETLSWHWLVIAALLQITAVACSVLRWDLLLRGQKIYAPFRHLFGSFLIGRFFGAFTPGGWTGLSGFRIYDIAKHTGQTAVSATVVAVDMLLGQLAFAVVVIIGSFFGTRYLGQHGVLLVDFGFLSLIAMVMALLTHPNWFRKLARYFPQKIQQRGTTAIEAFCAYDNHPALLYQSFFLAIGTHALNNLIFVASAQALHIPLSVGEVFFVSAMQILVTLIPASINGIGLREVTAVTLYTKVGLSIGEATLIPLLGFLVEMAISAVGGLVLLLRPVDYRPPIEQRARHSATPQHIHAEAKASNQV